LTGTKLHLLVTEACALTTGPWSLLDSKIAGDWTHDLRTITVHGP